MKGMIKLYTFGLAIILILVIAVISLIFFGPKKKYIAVVQFDNRQFDPQIEQRIWGIADWYEFAETVDKEFEINDLKEFYEIVLELR